MTTTRNSRTTGKSPAAQPDVIRHGNLKIVGLGGSASIVYGMIRRAQAETRKQSVTLRQLRRAVGVTSTSEKKAIRDLEYIGLIRVKRRAGRSPVITVRETYND